MSLVSSALRFAGSGLRELRERPHSQVPALDFLRSMAILGVIGVHYSVNPLRTASGEVLAAPNIRILNSGWTGVDLFFVLSGFLIGKQIWREMERTGAVKTGRFLLRRGFRIWPLYFFVLAFQAVFFPQFPVTWADVTFLSDYFRGGLGGGWSLSVEEQFYLAVPALLWLTHRRLKLRHYLWVLGAVVLLVPLVRTIQAEALFARGLAARDVEQTLHYHFHLHCEGLVLGLIISLVTVLKPAWFRRTAADGFSWIGAAISGAAVVVGLTIHHLSDTLFGVTSLALIFGGAVLFVLLDRSFLSRPLASWVFYPISRLSYGMYLNHFTAIYLTVPVLHGLAARMPDHPLVYHGVVLGGVTAVSIAMATVTFVLVEHPFLAMRERWLDKRAPRAAVPAPALAA